MRPLFTLLATITGFATLVVGTLFFSTLTLLLVWLPPRGSAVQWTSRWWARTWLFGCGVRARVGRETTLPADRGCVYLANHGSWLDIPALLATLPSARVSFAAKRGLFQIPIFGWALSAGGFIPVDRGVGSRAQDTFTRAIEQLRSGTSVIFFPEGTRTFDGQLAPLQRGGFLLALKAGVPVVPVGVRGAFEALPRTRWTIRPGTVELHYGEPVDVEEYGLRGRKRLMEDVRDRIAELAGLSASPPGEKDGAPGAQDGLDTLAPSSPGDAPAATPSSTSSR